MPDAGTQIDIATESTISWTDAAGWAYKAANLAFQIWNAKKNAANREADRDLIGRYHEETMKQLFKMEAKDDYKTAKSRADTYFSPIEQNFDHLTQLADTVEGGHESSDYKAAFATFAKNSVINEMTPEDHINGLYGELIGDVDALEPKLIDSFCKLTTFYDLKSSGTFVGAQYLEWCMSRYRMGLSVWALYHQLQQVFPDKLPQELNLADFADIDWSGALTKDELADATKEKFGDQIAKIVETSLPVIADQTSERYSPDAGSRSSSDSFFGWHTVTGKDEAEHFEKLRVHVATGWLRAPEGQVIVGVRLIKAKRIAQGMPDAFAHSSAVSIEIDCATPEDIANNNTAGISTFYLSDEDNASNDGSRTAIDDILTLGNGELNRVYSDAVKHNPDPDTSVAALTGISLKLIAGAMGSFHLDDGVGLEIELTEYDGATGKLGAKLDNSASQTSDGFADLTKHIKDDRISAGSYYTLTEDWDGEAEKFALRSATPEPMAMLCGARLHYDSDSRNMAMAVYPVSTLDLPSGD